LEGKRKEREQKLEEGNGGRRWGKSRIEGRVGRVDKTIGETGKLARSHFSGKNVLPLKVD